MDISIRYGRYQSLSFELFFKKQISRESRVVIQQARVFTQLYPHMIFILELQYDALAASSVARAAVPVQGQFVFLVQHHPGVHVLVVLSQNVRHKHVGAIRVTDKVGGVHVKALADISYDVVKRDGCVFKDRAQSLTSGHRKRQLSVSLSRITLVAFFSNHSSVAPLALVTVWPHFSSWTTLARDTFTASLPFDAF